MATTIILAIIFALQLCVHCNFCCSAIIFAMQLFLQWAVSFVCFVCIYLCALTYASATWDSRKRFGGGLRHTIPPYPSSTGRRALQLFLQCNYFCNPTSRYVPSVPLPPPSPPTHGLPLTLGLPNSLLIHPKADCILA